jgi:hypothetical protein
MLVYNLLRKIKVKREIKIERKKYLNIIISNIE